MKIAPKCPQVNRNWLMLGGVIVLGMVATGLSQQALHDRMARLDIQVRAVNRMVSAVVARRELAYSAQIHPTVVAAHDIPGGHVTLVMPALVHIADMPLVTIRR